MELKTCLQFDETDEPSTFNPELCLFLPQIDSLIYAEGSFLLCDKDETFPTLEFPSQICLMKEVAAAGQNQFLVLVIEEGRGLAILDLKSFKVSAQFIDIFPFKIVKIHQHPQSQQVFLLTSTPSLLVIDNFVLFTRLTSDLLKERFEAGQVVKEFHFPASVPAKNMEIKDFIVLENEILTVGRDQMISWWKFTEPTSPQGNQQSHSILNYFFTKPPQAKQAINQPPVNYLTLSSFLNEPGRCIDKILASSGNLVLLEDSTHGRLLLLDSEHSLIIKTFKGYRNCSASIKDRILRIWSENRFSLEEWPEFPFGESKHSLVEEASDSLGAFDPNGNFFLYSNKSNQLQLFI